MSKPSILFLCTGNSCRSQMAEGWLRQLKGERYTVYSAGIEAHGLNPSAVKVMAEEGVDISGQCSQTLADIDAQLDVVITVCGHADETCPLLSAAVRKIHVGFDDPPKLAAGLSPEHGLQHYRRVRDEIRQFIEQIENVL